MTNILQYILLLLIRLVKQCAATLSNLLHSIFGSSGSSFNFGNGSDLEMTNRTLTFESDGSSSKRASKNKQQKRVVRIKRQIAEGGFSYVYEAYDKDTQRKYALKRLNCGTDRDLVRMCQKEAGVHRTLHHHHHHHSSFLKLLGFQMEKQDVATGEGASSTVCYMLFPYLSGGSIRDEITRRKILPSSSQNDGDTRQISASMKQPRPFTQRQILSLFYDVVYAVSIMHECQLSHRDLKLENIMLDVDCENYNLNKEEENEGNYRAAMEEYGVRGKPVLMDFGSAGPVSVPLSTRSDVLTLIEEAASHTTVSYRPPELFEGGCRHGGSGNDLDYGRVDVWSLGCILYGLMYGSSPFEIEFVRSASTSAYATSTAIEEDEVKIVECTHLRVLGSIPRPRSHTTLGKRYKEEMMDLVEYILVQDRFKRPDVKDVLEKVESLLVKCGGQTKKKRNVMGGRNRTGVISGFGGGDDDDDEVDEENLFDSLLR